MNINTGELHESMEGALADLIAGAERGEDLTSMLMPLDDTDYEKLKGMNRAERRQWARENKDKNE